MSVVRSWSIGRVLSLAVLAIAAVVSLFPFYWMIVGTTLHPNDVLKGILSPGSEFMQNWAKATQYYKLALFFFNSIKIALITVVFGLIVNGLAAFGFEKYPSKARDKVFALLLLTLIIPQIALVIPMFRMFAFFNLLNSHAAVVLPSIMSVFIVFFMRQNFKMFPTEIIEAARVDGTSELNILVRIVTPSMKATYASAAIYIFLGQWNTYLWPLIVLLSDARKTLPLAMAAMMSTYTIEYGSLMILACISVLPVLVLFLSMQKQFVAGLLGSVK